MGHWGTCPPPRLSTISFIVHFGANLTANYPNIVYSARSARADVNNSQQAAAAPDPEVRRECPMTKSIALPLLATNPGDATDVTCYVSNRMLNCAHLVMPCAANFYRDFCSWQLLRPPTMWNLLHNTVFQGPSSVHQRQSSRHISG